MQEVQVVGRRGTAQAAFTTPEFRALCDLPGVDVVVDPSELTLDPATAAAHAERRLDRTTTTKIELARDAAARRPTVGHKRVVFRYLLFPLEVLGGEQVSGLVCARNEFVGTGASVAPTGERVVVDCGLVMRAVGYRGRPVDGLPFDEARGVVPNLAGRVVDEGSQGIIPGVYVAGWIKRGATGGIGMNKVCGKETAASVLADLAHGRLARPDVALPDVEELVTARGGTPVGGAGWRNIDDAERRAGARQGRRRVKLVRREDLLAAAQHRTVSTSVPSSEPATGSSGT